jgi:tetratricopeptide (TPR) repeat protein
MYWYANVADEYENRRQFDKAIRYCQHVQDLSRQSVQDPSYGGDVLGEVLDSLAYSQWQAGDLDGGLATMRKAFDSDEKAAANGHAALRSNEVDVLWHEGMILGKADGELSLGRTPEALAAFQRALTIAEELAHSDSDDALSRHEVAEVGLEIGNILRHTNPQKALTVYDHSLATLREAKSNSQAKRDEAELLAASSYAERWTGRNDEAKQRIDKAVHLLREAKILPADKIEPMSEADHTMRASADFYAGTHQPRKAVDGYQELQGKLMAWNPNLDGDLRDAICISRTWLALAEALRETGRAEEAAQLEAHSKTLLKQWQQKLPNGPTILKQASLGKQR